MEVSYSSVARLCGVPRSCVQRRFGSVEQLRRGTLETWLHQFKSAEDSCARPGATGVWELLFRWFLAQARHPVPFCMLQAPVASPLSAEWDALRGLVAGAVSAWSESLAREIQAAPPGEWRPEVDAEALVRSLVGICLGTGPAEALVGPLAAIEAAAHSCRVLLGHAAHGGLEVIPADTVPALIQQAGHLLRLRPTHEWVADESTTAQGVRPRQGGSTPSRVSRQKAPATWDSLLLEATMELDDYRRRNPEEEDEDFPR